MEWRERRGSRQPSGVLSFCVCAPTALFPEWSTVLDWKYLDCLYCDYFIRTYPYPYYPYT